MELETQVIVIGGGATGTAVLRDLSMRGLHAMLFERGNLSDGTTGNFHGLLHSGGRYVANDPETATECHREGEILKRLAPHCIDDCGGLFVAVEGDDPGYAERFPDHCRQAGIPCTPLSTAEALEREPTLSKRLLAACAVAEDRKSVV